VEVLTASEKRRRRYALPPHSKILTLAPSPLCAFALIPKGSAVSGGKLKLPVVRTRGDLGFPEIRSWRIAGFRRHLVFYRELPDRIQV
jgi:hypothetical protein